MDLSSEELISLWANTLQLFTVINTAKVKTDLDSVMVDRNRFFQPMNCKLLISQLAQL